MLEQLEAGWEIMKNMDSNSKDKTEEEADARREFAHVYMRLGATARSAAHATKRVVSDAQVERYEALVERINEEMREMSLKK